MESRWSEREAAEFVERLAPRWGEDLALCVYGSRLIGRDPDLVMHGGGNTSLKGTVTTLVGGPVEALFVKGSGWDLDAIEPPGLPAVDLAHLRRLRTLGELSDEEMVNQLRTHLFEASAPNPSVETLLHAFLPHRFVDHTHADIALVLTNRPRDEAEAMVREAFGPRWAIVPYVMPGFALAKLAAEVYERDPSVEGLVLMNHGRLTFADDARTAYELMIAGADRAERFVRARARARRPTGRGARLEVPPAGAAARLAPVLRGALAEATGDADRPWRRMILEHRASEATLDTAIGRHTALGDADLFDMEYWSLEQAKLGKAKEAALAGQVALVTGAAGAIGFAVCQKLIEAGAHVVAADLAGERLAAAAGELDPRRRGLAAGGGMDVTGERA